MSQNDTEEGDGLVGLSVGRAAEEVAPTVEEDPEMVREILRGISDGDTVTRAALDDALADVSKVVATPETRVEVAGDALAEARETGAPVADTDVVHSRLAAFEADLSALEERVEALGPRLSGVIDRAGDSGDLYTVAKSIRQLRTEATDAQNAVDKLATEIREFTRRLRDPGVWADTLQEDIDTIEESFDELLAAVDRLLEAEADRTENVNPALAWADATLQYRVRELSVNDIQTELEALEKLVAENGGDIPDDEIRNRLRQLEALQTAVADGLDEAFDPSWDSHYSETVASFDRTLAEFEPPVPWAEVQHELERHRKRLKNPE